MNQALYTSLLTIALLSLAGCVIESPPPNSPAETSLEPLSEHTEPLPEADFEATIVEETDAPPDDAIDRKVPATPKVERDLETWPNLCRIADYLERVDGHIVAHITIVNRRPVPIDTLIWMEVFDGRRGTETERITFENTPEFSEIIIKYPIESLTSLPFHGYINLICRFGFEEYEDQGDLRLASDNYQLEFQATTRSSSELSTSSRPYTLKSRW